MEEITPPSESQDLEKPNPPSEPTSTKVSTNERERLVHLFLLALVIVLLIIAVIFVIINRGNFFRVASPPQTTSTASQSQSPMPTSQTSRATPTPKSFLTFQVPASWNRYESTLHSITFRYPSESYNLKEDPKPVTGSKLLHKTELFIPEDPIVPVFRLAVWDHKNGQTLTKDSLSTWCQTLGSDEIRKQKILCAFLDPRDLKTTSIGGKKAYSISYYSSFGAEVNFIVIPRENDVVTIQVDKGIINENKTKVTIDQTMEKVLKTVEL